MSERIIDKVLLKKVGKKSWNRNKWIYFLFDEVLGTLCHADKLSEVGSYQIYVLLSRGVKSIILTYTID